MITLFELPCARCGEIRYLHTATGLCVTVPEEGKPQPVPLCELLTCHEWSIFYWTVNLDVQDDFESEAA